MQKLQTYNTLIINIIIQNGIWRRKYTCEKSPILFVINKFYFYICINKTKAPTVRRGRKALGTKEVNNIMYIGLYIIISLILVVLRR